MERTLSGTGLLTASTVRSQVQSGLPGDLGQAPSLGLSCTVGLWVMQQAGCSGPGYMGPRLFTAHHASPVLGNVLEPRVLGAPRLCAFHSLQPIHRWARIGSLSP